MRLKLILLATSAILSTPGLSAEVARSRFDATVYNEQVSDLGIAGFRTLPSERDVTRVMGRSATTAYRIRWDCAVTPNGQLKDCRRDSLWPENADSAAVDRLLGKVRLDRRSTDLALGHNARVALSAYLDDARPGLDRTCPPGWCPATPAPPGGMGRPPHSR